MEDALQRIERKLDTMAVELSGGMAGLRGHLSGLNVEMTSLRGEVTGVKAETTSLKGEVTGLKAEMANVRGALAGVENRLGNVEGGLSRLTETVHQQGLRQEYLIDKVTLTMEGLEGGRQSAEKRFDEVMAKLDERIQPIETATRYLATKKPTNRR